MTISITQKLLFNLVQGVLGRSVNWDNYDVSVPQVLSTGLYNTQVVFQPKVLGINYIKQTFKYNRINLSNLTSVIVDRGSAINTSDLLIDISNKLKLGIVVDLSVSDLTQELSVVKIQPEDIVDFVLPPSSGGTTTAATLYSHINSYVFIGSVPFTLKEYIPPVVFFSSFSIYPNQAVVNSPLRVKAIIENLTPNTEYKLRLYYQLNNNNTVYNGSLLSLLSNQVTDSFGKLIIDFNSEFSIATYTGFIWIGVFPITVPDASILTSNGSSAVVKSNFNIHNVITVSLAEQLPYYAYWNPGSVSSVVTSDNLTASGLTIASTIKSNIGLTTGKWYWEYKASNPGGIGGVARASELINYFLGNGPFSWGFSGYSNQALFNNDIKTSFINNWIKSVVVGFYLDMDTGTLGVIVNGTDLGIIFRGITGTVYPSASGNTRFTNVAITANFGKTAFSGVVKPGYNPGVYNNVFTPLALPNLQGWYDADDAETIVEVNSKVFQWNDKSGNRRHAVQSLDTNRYIRTLNSVNGKAAMINSGLTCSMTIPSVVLPAYSKYVFAVLSNTNETTVLGNNLHNNQYFLQLSESTFGSIKEGRNASNSFLSTLGVGASNGTIHLVSHTEKRSNVRLSFDSTTGTDNLFIDSTVNQLTSIETAGKYLQGKLCEIIFGSEALDNAQIARVNTYLQNKWGTP